MLEQKNDFNEAGFTQISLEEAMKLAEEKEDAIILDVRTLEEYNEGHLKNARLLPYDEVMKHADTVLPDKEAPILIYCRAGRRSVIASHVLVAMGYTNIYEFGGITLW
jgi:rhodanese-related sulfurtransferase